ncbi:hypothetical protein ACP4OV_005803 [Aristida adscensionis]
MEMRRRSRRTASSRASRPRLEPASSPEAKVLGDDNLLREILVRLDHPTCLVHAALVSTHWLRNASDPAFLRRFRKLSPPRLLGLYALSSRGGFPSARFQPQPHPRELDVVFRRARFDLGPTSVPGLTPGTVRFLALRRMAPMGHVVDCRNGRVLAMLSKESLQMDFVVCSPITKPEPAQDDHVVVPSPRNNLGKFQDRYLLLPEDGGDGRSYVVIRIEQRCREVVARHFVLRAGAWGDEGRTSAPIEPPASWLSYRKCALLHNNKFYMLGAHGFILVLDVVSMSLSVINLPDGVGHEENRKNLELLVADGGTGFHLIHVKGFDIHVWQHDNDGDVAGEWKLLDTICVREAIAHLARPDWESTWIARLFDADGVYRVGDNADQLLLKVGREVFCMNISNRKVEKVFEKAREDDPSFMVYPITMVWPPHLPGPWQ